MIERLVTCAVCGKTFATTAHVRKYCDRCARVVNVIQASPQYFATEKPFREEYMLDEARRRLSIDAPTVERDDGEVHRCPYCGRKVSRDGEYCKYCQRMGFDGIHQITGRTNGWDRKDEGRPKVVGGWRGQKRAGGRAASLDRLARWKG